MNKTNLILARHGNTFNKGEIVRRVGCKTDIPLVETEKSYRIANYLVRNDLIPDVVISGPLLRHKQTAQIVINELNINLDLLINEIFSEFDYGIDENKPEQAVINRLGHKAIKDWNEKAIVPNGWNINVTEIRKIWHSFFNEFKLKYKDKTVLVVTSNGMLRFSPIVFNNNIDNSMFENLKVGTGNLCHFYFDIEWHCAGWNIKP